jgi:hypothetical protein
MVTGSGRPERPVRSGGGAIRVLPPLLRVHAYILLTVSFLGMWIWLGLDLLVALILPPGWRRIPLRYGTEGAVQHDYGSAALYYSGAFEDNKAAGKTPIREEFSTDHLGDGIRVIRFVPLSADDPQAPDHPQDPLAPQDPDPVLGALAYHWRTKSPVVDVQLLAFTHELGRLYAALPDFDAFARTIALTATPAPE